MTAVGERNALTEHARYLGADAAMAAASWQIMSESDARSILDDVDPEVLDRYREPNLSGQWADDPTPDSLYDETRPEHCTMRTSGLGSQVVCGDCGSDCECYVCTRDSIDTLADAWADGRDQVWHKALQGVALRTLGIVGTAVRVERELEVTVAGMRTMAGLS